jgi:16S rRNA (guanine(527)-N(7))-methyltransferase RsmG
MISKDLFDVCVREIGVSLPENAFAQFDSYAKLLAEYNEKVNLTAITDPDGITVKHFADSLYFLKHVAVPEGASLCDVGTGAGFPGVCLKLARPDIQLTLFDSVNKKLDFLRFLSKELGVDAEIVHARAEEAGQTPEYRGHFDFAAARAVAALNKLCEYCIPLVKQGGYFVPLKAELSEEERTAGYAAARILGAKLSREVRYTLPNGDGRELLIFEKKSQTPTKYPRVSAQIAKSPLK